MYVENLRRKISIGVLRVTSCIALVLSLCSNTSAKLIGIHDVLGDAAKADLIVVGTVKRIPDVSSIAGIALQFAAENELTKSLVNGGPAYEISVTRVLKDSPANPCRGTVRIRFADAMPYLDVSPSAIRISRENREISWLDTNVSGIFMLRKVSPGLYDFMDEDHLYIPASLNYAPGTCGATTIEKIAHEMAAVFLVAHPADGDRSGYSYDSNGKAIQLYTLDQTYDKLQVSINTIPPALICPLLWTATRSSNEKTKLAACACLLSKGEWKALAVAAPYMLDPKPNIQHAVYDVAWTAVTIETPEAIPLFKKLLHSKDALVRSCAERGLRQINCCAPKSQLR
jgi:hypothetical protein